MQEERIRKLNSKEYSGGDIVYWMSRDQRIQDNWALARARERAERLEAKLAVIFCLTPVFLQAPWRHYHFMIEGLKKLEEGLRELNVPFLLLPGDPVQEIPRIIDEEEIGYLVTDFSPLRIKQDWENGLRKKIEIPFESVDTHNIVPCWLASDKQEFAAYTFRPKIKKLLGRFLSDSAIIEKQKSPPGFRENNWAEAGDSVKADRSVKPVNEFKPGEEEARKVLNRFLDRGLDGYSKLRNDPNQDSLSNLSIYLHYGQISAQAIAQEVKDSQKGSREDREAFLEELIVRKELSDNYCFYNPDYDNFKGFPDWAKKTLDNHRDDEREYIYSLEEFEAAATHDPLWNAAQEEMVTRGKMHGFMRMYWAKKILEWTPNPEEAQEIAIALNDKYELDGRDPNGYTGIAWSIGGVHDRAWFEREIFGKVRYMNYNGCKRKFDVNRYIARFSS